MNLRIIALVFQFLINCWPKSNIINHLLDLIDYDKCANGDGGL